MTGHDRAGATIASQTQPVIAMPSVALVWFRRDLRLADNPAWQAALEGGHVPLPVYVHAPHEEGSWAPGAASSAWLHRSLQALDADLRARGSALVLATGDSLPVLQRLLEQSGAEAVFWNRRYEPAVQARDADIKRGLREQGLDVRSFNGSLLSEPWQLATGQGTPYRVFTPYWRTAQARMSLPPLTEPPPRLTAHGQEGLPLEALGLAPSPQWDAGFWEHWQPGEAGAREALEVFVDGALDGYLKQRDRPDRVGTSLLSPHLHFGEIAPWRIVASLQAVRTAARGADIDGYIRQLGWRDFAHHLMHHFPESCEHDLNPRFARFHWARPDGAALDAWQRGRTGIPIIDAGMRELWQTGYMHNRVRMIAASYLTKHMRMHWLQGARWFWDTLVDADLANNTLGWQWVAGTGADAAPYFRIFNPVTQAQKFDPAAAYISRWLPELAGLPLAARFAPWEFPDVHPQMGDYPRKPMVELGAGRDAALAAYRGRWG